MAGGFWTRLLGRKDNRADAITYGAGGVAVGVGSLNPHFRDYQSYLKAYKLPWVKACVGVISYNCANVGLSLVDRDKEPEDDSRVVTSSPFLALLNKPNPFQTKFQLIESLVMYMELTGNGFLSHEGLDGAGRPTELYSLRPDFLSVLPDPKTRVSGYKYTVNGRSVLYAANEMTHLRYPNPLDDLYGMGTIEAGESRFDSELAMGEHERSFWRNGAKITGILQTDSAVQETTFSRMKDTVQRFFQGSGYSTLLLENGLKYQSVSDGPAKLGMLDMAKASRDMILAMFGVPPTKVGILENANYKAQNADEFFWTETIDPKLTRLEQDFQSLVDLFHPGKNYAVEFDRLNFTDDLPAATVADLMQKAQAFTVNQIRDYMGHVPVDGGDVILVPSQTAIFDPATGEISATGIPVSEAGSAGPAPAPAVAPKPAAAGNTPPPAAGGAATATGGAIPGVTPPDTVPVSPATGAAMAPVKRARLDAKRVIRTSVDRPATAGLIRRDHLEVRDGAVKKHGHRLVTFFGGQEARVKAKLMTFKRRKAAITPGALFDDEDENKRLGDALQPVYDDGIARGQEIASKVGVSVNFDLANPRLQDLTGKLANRVTGINGTTRDGIGTAVNEGMRRGYSVVQIADGVPDENYPGITGVFDQAKGYRAEMIARTETMFAYNGAALAAYADSGEVAEVEFLDGTDDPECDEVNGTTASLDDAEDIMADEHPNGTRAVVPILGDPAAVADDGSAAEEGDLVTADELAARLRDRKQRKAAFRLLNADLDRAAWYIQRRAVS